MSAGFGFVSLKADFWIKILLFRTRLKSSAATPYRFLSVFPWLTPSAAAVALAVCLECAAAAAGQHCPRLRTMKSYEALRDETDS